MISYALTLAGIIGATLIPVFAALYIVANLKPVPTKYIAAAGVGLAFWFFFDTMGDAAQLDVNQSFTGGAAHIGIVVVFIAGVTTLALFDHFAVPSSAPESSRFSKMLFIIPAGIALVMGVHGLGEGWDFASAASSATSQSLTDAFGGLSAVASYPMHKALEASIVASVYTIYVGRNSAAFEAKWHLPVLGLLFGLPSVIGASIGYYVSFNTTYFYAFGVTAALYAALRLSEGVISKSKTDEQVPAFLGWKVFLSILIGFLLLYTAALFH
ncbi:MAG: hypothetical protein ABSE82_00900 [Nitrososphaerales archaeon]